MNQKDKFTIVQFPNIYLWVMILSWLIFSLSSGIISGLARTVFTVSAIIWSYLEVTSGVNWFRKLLGIIVMGLMFLDIVRLIVH